MYASLEHVQNHYAVVDQRAVSQRAAERYQQLSAVAESRRSGVGGWREARAQRRDQRRNQRVAVA